MQRLSSEDESSKLVHAITDSSSVTRIDALATDYLPGCSCLQLTSGSGSWSQLPQVSKLSSACWTRSASTVLAHGAQGLSSQELSVCKKDSKF